MVSPSYIANHCSRPTSQGLWPLPTRLPWQQPLCFPITLSERSQAARSSLLGPCQGGPSYLIGVSPYWQTLPYPDTHGSTLILNPQKPLPDTDFPLLPGLSSQGLQWLEVHPSPALAHARLGFSLEWVWWSGGEGRADAEEDKHCPDQPLPHLRLPHGPREARGRYSLEGGKSPFLYGGRGPLPGCRRFRGICVLVVYKHQ